MTMQVGMIASDGLLLASDTRSTRSPNVSGLGVRHGYNSHKIKIDDTGSMAIACARDMVAANNFADVLFTLRDEKEQNRIRRIKEIGTEVADGHNMECIIGFAYPTPSLYYFQYIDKAVTVCDQIFTYVFGGDAVNAAIFWIRNYYDFQPINQLKRLAAHMIISAGIISPDFISGLEIVYCDGSGFNRLSVKDNISMELEAKEWNKKIGQFILTGTAVS
jgi:hypothetical protein